MTRHVSLDSRPDLKQAERDRIAEQTAKFLAKGGQIKTLQPTERADKANYNETGRGVNDE